MPRPRKCRKICCMPKIQSFAPTEADSGFTVEITLDEFETIRLIDFDKLSQEECADKMGVARTTVQAMYSSARYKIASFLVNGAKLSINGGYYELSGGPFCPHRQRHEPGCK